MIAAAAADVLEQLTEITAPEGLPVTGPLRLRRAWPRAGGHVLVEYEDGSGRRIVGQRIADREQFDKVLRATAATRPAAVGALPDLKLLLQGYGADRKLNALGALADGPGATLVVHRPERRGVVRLDEARWAKVVRPERTHRLVRTAASLAAAEHVSTPQLLQVDVSMGLTLWSHVPGLPLIEVLAGHGAGEICRGVGAALRRVHAAPPPPGVDRHGPRGEARTLQTWVERLHMVTPAWAKRLRGHLPAVVADLEAGGDTLVLSHGDLHDRQILVAGDQVGLIDADTVALGEAAQDLANLLVHVELRGLQGRCSPDQVARAAAAVVEGYRPDSAVLARVPAYAAATRFRLAAVYRLRPSRPNLCMELLDVVGAPAPGM